VSGEKEKPPAPEPFGPGGGGGEKRFFILAEVLLIDVRHLAQRVAGGAHLKA